MPVNDIELNIFKMQFYELKIYQTVKENKDSMKVNFVFSTFSDSLPVQINVAYKRSDYIKYAFKLNTL